MLKANIDKNNEHQIIVATGGINEMLNDIAVLVNGLYKQFQGVAPMTAVAFRSGLIGLLSDPDGPAWNDMGNQMGYVIKKG